MARSSSADRSRLRDALQAVQNALVTDAIGFQLDRVLAYWALPADRNLPIVLLDRPLREIVETPFERLAGTPGIGQKKLDTLVVLLRRAQEDLLARRDSRFRTDRDEGSDASAPRLDPDHVSETQWMHWRATVEAHGLMRERLGHLAPTLLDLSTVIWETPLSEFFSLSLNEMRKLKGYGEKRVRDILEIFHSLHVFLSRVGKPSGLSVRLTPRFVPPLEEWFMEVFARHYAPDWQELRESLVLPLMNQLALDAGPLVQKLAEGRLGIEGQRETVRVLARRNNVTRARVYQLLDTCEKVMTVRWPEGRAFFAALGCLMDAPEVDGETRRLFHATRALFFPDRGAAERARARVATRPSHVEAATDDDAQRAQDDPQDDPLIVAPDTDHATDMSELANSLESATSDDRGAGDGALVDEPPRAAESVSITMRPDGGATIR